MRLIHISVYVNAINMASLIYEKEVLHILQSLFFSFSLQLMNHLLRFFPIVFYNGLISPLSSYIYHVYLIYFFVSV